MSNAKNTPATKEVSFAEKLKGSKVALLVALGTLKADKTEKDAVIENIESCIHANKQMKLHMEFQSSNLDKEVTVAKSRLALAKFNNGLLVENATEYFNNILDSDEAVSLAEENVASNKTNLEVIDTLISDLEEALTAVKAIK